MKSIEVERVKQYNREEFLPKCETSKSFVKLLKQKHLTLKNIESIKSLGYQVIIKGEVL